MSHQMTAFCRRLMLAGVIGAVLAAAIFILWPGLDLAISAMFAPDGTGFPVAGSPVAVAFRWLFRITTHLVFVVAMACLAVDLFRQRASVERRFALTFASLVYLIGPGLLVNFGLKSHWGRARPREIIPFGGDATYTPFWLPTDQCPINCSFVSGEASVTSAAALVLLMIFLPVLNRRWRWTLCLAATAFVISASGLRVVLGAHFVSDVTFGIFFMMMLVPAIWLILRRIGG